MKLFPFHFALQEVLKEKYFIQTRFETQKVTVTVGKTLDHDEHLLPDMKPEKN